MEQSTLLALGPGFTRGLTRWPEIAANLAMRGLRRSRALAADAAIASIVGIEERLLIMLWHLDEFYFEQLLEFEERGERIDPVQEIETARDLVWATHTGWPGSQAASRSLGCPANGLLPNRRAE